jgi:hypothetical protein
MMSKKEHSIGPEGYGFHHPIKSELRFNHKSSPLHVGHGVIGTRIWFLNIHSRKKNSMFPCQSPEGRLTTLFEFLFLIFPLWVFSSPD